MKSKKTVNISKEKIVILLGTLLIIFGLFILSKGNFKSYNKENSTNIVSNVSAQKQINIDAIVKDYKSKYNIYSQNILDKKILSLLAYDKDNSIYTSFIVDANTGKEMQIEDLLKDGMYQDFQNKINYLIDLKYPKFIADKLKNEKGTIAYEIKENEMVIYFSGYTFEPEYTSEIKLKVNYNEIKDYINFSYKLDSEYENENGFHYDKNKPTIAITFDDGPNGNKTKAILKALNDNKMHATFFMVGSKMRSSSTLIGEVLDSHNEIGSHTYSHINMKRVEEEKVKEELRLTNEIFKSITKQNIKLMRPPYGAYQKELVSSYPYSFVLWNVDTNDWRYHNVEYLVNYILDNATDGNVILMHDSYEASVEAVEKVLPQLYVRGIQVVSISELAAIKGYTLEFGEVYHSFK